MRWIIRSNDYKEELLKAEITNCKRNEKILSSLNKLGLYWGLAVVSIFIPVLHFFLVPAFLMVGVYTFLSQYKNTHFLKLGSCTCPSCKNIFVIQNKYFHNGLKLRCDVCFEQMTLLSRQTIL